MEIAKWIIWFLLGLSCLSVLVGIGCGVGFISYITKSSRDAKKLRKAEKLEQEKRDKELFEQFKAELKKRGISNEKK